MSLFAFWMNFPREPRGRNDWRDNCVERTDNTKAEGRRIQKMEGKCRGKKKEKGNRKNRKKGKRKRMDCKTAVF